MPVFEYTAKTLAGASISGILKAKDQDELKRFLLSNRIFLISAIKKPTQIALGLKRGIRRVDVSRFTRQFATMIGAGLPMVQCLEILSLQSESKKMKNVINKVRESVQSGSTLSSALSQHSNVFDDLYVSMVDAGEVSGTLDQILLRLASYREKGDSVARKVKAAMAYPAIVITVAIGVVIVMLTHIVPIFANMFEGIGAELPAPTKMVLSISEFLRGNIIIGLFALLGLLLFYRYYSKSSKGAYTLDKLKLKIPLFGNLVKKTAVSRFTRTLGTLVSSGVPILDALHITAKTAGNRVIYDAVNKSALLIAEGETITQPLSETGVFPPMVTQMISVGEKTGNLDQMLSKIADFYDEEVDTAVSALTSIIEPLIIVTMGIIIGGILVAMYLPMFEIIGKIG